MDPTTCIGGGVWCGVSGGELYTALNMNYTPEVWRAREWFLKLRVCTAAEGVVFNVQHFRSFRAGRF